MRKIFLQNKINLKIKKKGQESGKKNPRYFVCILSFFFWVGFLSMLIFGKLYRNEIKTTKMKKRIYKFQRQEKSRRILEWEKSDVS